MRIRVGSTEHELEILELSGDRMLARLDGETVEGDVRRTADGGWSLLLDGKSWEVWVESTGRARSGEVTVAVGTDLLSVRMEDPRSYVPAGGSGTVHEGWQEVRAPMPGKVVAVLVSEGDEIEAGQGLVVVEAMKMENEFSSPKAGRVVQLPVEEGKAVEAGQLLAAVE